MRSTFTLNAGNQRLQPHLSPHLQIRMDEHSNPNNEWILEKTNPYLALATPHPTLLMLRNVDVPVLLRLDTYSPHV